MTLGERGGGLNAFNWYFALDSAVVEPQTNVKAAKSVIFYPIF